MLPRSLLESVSEDFPLPAYLYCQAGAMPQAFPTPAAFLFMKITGDLPLMISPTPCEAALRPLFARYSIPVPPDLSAVHMLIT